MGSVAIKEGAGIPAPSPFLATSNAGSQETAHAVKTQAPHPFVPGYHWESQEKPTGLYFFAGTENKGKGDDKKPTLKWQSQLFRVIGRSTNDDGTDPHIVIEFDDEFGHSQLPIRAAIPYSMLYEQNTLAPYLAGLGMRVHQGASGPLAKYFTHGEFMPINNTITFNMVGWNEVAGRWLFISPMGQLYTGTGSFAQELLLSSSLKAKVTREIADVKGTFKNIDVNKGGDPNEQKKLLHVAKSSKVWMIQILAALAAVLLDITGRKPFAVHVYGGTGTGKTIGEHIAISMFRFIGEPHSWDMTPTSIEETPRAYTDSPLEIDEMRRADKKKLAGYVYKIISGMGRDRRNADLTKR